MISEYKYLGVLLTSSLDWSKHVTRVCKNARQQVGILYRKFYGHCNSSTLKQLYLSYVRPHLEYAAPVWDPHQQGLINSLESVQKFALKLCTKNWNASYDETLSNCNLPTLANRRRLLKVIIFISSYRFYFKLCMVILFSLMLPLRGVLLCPLI